MIELCTRSLALICCNDLMQEEGFHTLLKRMPKGGNFAGILWDRRNTGGSQHAYTEKWHSKGEPEIHADDLAGLICLLTSEGGGKKRPAILVGNSSGARVSLLCAAMHPEAVAGVVLMNLTGGHAAAEFLADTYHLQFARVASSSGLDRVFKTAHFRTCLAKGGAVGGIEKSLIDVSAEEFIRAQTAWGEWMARTADWPVVGIDEATMRKVEAPALVIHNFVPEDDMHTRAVSERVASILRKKDGKETLSDGFPRCSLMLSDYQHFPQWTARMTSFFEDVWERNGKLDAKTESESLCNTFLPSVQAGIEGTTAAVQESEKEPSRISAGL
uniref:AB hydrolase-1 domain-containing protein n=1 Tax=Chromera velia CCMP2878 TaxID=1169474 RepID=A0A0G4HR10_9ALVE|eukprot:Cvel_30561.t1-p1 / transcript=Cvel_30561.t1 / gene=Cvel_30561 / organism=Chromera_velia_CCMP2878 / gene_product=hypothetical protein / transcript_product=hypothetical protein / location=Cvel_scaffold4376:1817-3374(+) / protein_length=328 / sequence_SO=supercontig / SO=protein_coding / is_pseudo=false